ncbi:hypothetical protein IWX63_003066 [Arthrobacter sp. CAN_A2]|uniref:hypothetical protein n=1 Tax=Arthrobacter sp. CAN_A2 TaxID=2787718 RepID=UPI0018EFACD7
MEHHENGQRGARPRTGSEGSQVADMQSAIFAVAARSKGREVEDVKRMLQEEFDHRQVTPQAGPWLDAVATSAAIGKPYIISNEALWATEARQDAGERGPHSSDA